MNYLANYNKLIKRAKERTLDGYSEKHHILPKCIGGSNEPDNLVELTAREHFIAHILLVKIYPNKIGLIKAVQMMCTSSYSHKEQRSMNRMYGWLREKHSQSMSESQIGKNNSQFNTIWIYNEELKESKKIPKELTIPIGWKKGRKLNWDKPIIKNDSYSKKMRNLNKKVNTIKRNIKKKLLNKQYVMYDISSKKKLAEYQYILFRSVGFETYKNIANYNGSFENLIMYFKRNAKNYVSMDHRNVKKRMESKTEGSQ